MNRSFVVGVLVGLPVFYALLDGDFSGILVTVIGGYVTYTLLSQSGLVLLQWRIVASALSLLRRQ